MLQYLFALFLVATEEGGKLPLGQHGHAVELLEGKPDGLLNLAVAVVHAFPVGIALLHPPAGLAVGAVASDAQLQACGVVDAVIAFEEYLAVAVVFWRNAQPCVLVDATDADEVVVSVFEGVLLGVHGSGDSGSGFVEG